MNSLDIYAWIDWSFPIYLFVYLSSHPSIHPPREEPSRQMLRLWCKSTLVFREEQGGLCGWIGVTGGEEVEGGEGRDREVLVEVKTLDAPDGH